MSDSMSDLSRIIDNELAVTLDAIKYRAKDLKIPNNLLLSTVAHDMLAFSTSTLLLLGVADTIVKDSMNDKIKNTIMEKRESKCH